MSLLVVRSIGLVTVQDLGRPGHMHEAVPPGGALVRGLLVAANRAARNADDAPGIEVMGQLVVRAETQLAISVDGAPRRTLSPGEEVAITSHDRRAAYLAVRGGIDAPLVLDGRGALLCAGLGRRLRAADRLAVGYAPVVDAAPLAPPVLADEVTVIPGPDLGAFSADALAVLVSAPYRILPDSNRVGTRLDGPVLSRAANAVEASRPMVRGALEVPGDGLPIVLGPEHPTTGGYPIIAVVAHADLDRVFAIPLGRDVRFRVSA